MIYDTLIFYFTLPFWSHISNLKSIKISKGTLLNTDPGVRPNINELMFHLENIAQTRSLDLGENLRFLKKTELLLQNGGAVSAGANQGANTIIKSAVGAQASVSNAGQSAPSNTNWMGSAFKGGNSIFKTLKDASSKVYDTVQR